MKQSSNGDPVRILRFQVTTQRFGVEIGALKRVCPMMNVRPLPSVPSWILGTIHLSGLPVAVVDLKARLGEKGDIAWNSQLIVLETSRRPLALLVDRVGDVVTVNRSDIVPSDQILPSLPLFHGAARLPDGLIYLYDVERFLSLEEAMAIDHGLAAADHG